VEEKAGSAPLKPVARAPPVVVGVRLVVVGVPPVVVGVAAAGVVERPDPPFGSTSGEQPHDRYQ
jgi:hypothetical protein